MSKSAALIKRVPPPEHLQRWLFLPDTHAPYHDKLAWRLVMRVMNYFEFYGVNLLGDFFDCNAVSDHRKDPSRERSLKRELAAGRELIAELDAYGFKKKKVQLGNHEYRHDRYIWDKAPELYEMYETKEIFGFDDTWEVTPYMEDDRVGKLNVTHDLGKAGFAATRAALHDYNDNVAIGHTHMFNMLVEGDAKGEAHVGASFGWLGDRTKVDYKHQMKARKEWALGFGVGRVRSNGVIYIEPVPIVNYTCVVGDKLFWLSEEKAA